MQSRIPTWNERSVPRCLTSASRRGERTLVYPTPRFRAALFLSLPALASPQSLQHYDQHRNPLASSNTWHV